VIASALLALGLHKILALPEILAKGPAHIDQKSIFLIAKRCVADTMPGMNCLLKTITYLAVPIPLQVKERHHVVGS